MGSSERTVNNVTVPMSFHVFVLFAGNGANLCYQWSNDTQRTFAKIHSQQENLESTATFFFHLGFTK
jgi:hypothetical protein